MRAFANLIDRLVYTRSRNGKLALIADYLRSTSDTDRGWVLAALTGELDFPAVKASAVRTMAMERVDEMLFRLLRIALDSENAAFEPSAAAALTGPAMLLQSQAGREYLEHHALTAKMENAVHVAWATGGGMVPAAEMEQYYQRGLFACG